MKDHRVIEIIEKHERDLRDGNDRDGWQALREVKKELQGEMRDK